MFAPSLNHWICLNDPFKDDSRVHTREYTNNKLLARYYVQRKYLIQIIMFKQAIFTDEVTKYNKP